MIELPADLSERKLLYTVDHTSKIAKLQLRNTGQTLRRVVPFLPIQYSACALQYCLQLRL